MENITRKVNRNINDPFTDDISWKEKISEQIELMVVGLNMTDIAHIAVQIKVGVVDNQGLYYIPQEVHKLQRSPACG